MNVLIINTNRNQNPMPVMPLGACMVAEATARAGHEVQLLDLMFSRSPVRSVREALARQQPDLVGLSIRNIDNNDMQHPEFYPADLTPILQAVKEWRREVVIVLGGAAVAVMPEELLRYTRADFAVAGDGETAFPALLEKFASPRDFAHIPGLCWFDNGAFRQNPLRQGPGEQRCSVPDLARWLDVRAYQRRLATAPVQSKLGCHFRCIYCTYRKIEGASYRLMEPASVASTVCKLAEMGFRNIEFVDNVFNSPYEHALEVCAALAATRHQARLQTLELNPLYLDDVLIEAMERAGFVGAGITVESANSLVLANLKKGYSAAEVHRAAEVIRRHRLPCLWIFMLGGPGETEQTVAETLRFAETKVRPQDTVFFTAGIRIYPGTELETIARAEGVLPLPASQMLEPVFYLSPALSRTWLVQRVKQALRTNMHFISGETLSLSYLPFINSLGARLGIEPPLWRYTRYIRRGLRSVGVDA